MVPNPCCMDLQKAVRILAVVDIVFAALQLLVGILALIAAFAYSDQELREDDLSFGSLLAAALIVIAVGAFGVAIGVLLYLGANQRNTQKCKIWFYVAVILIVFSVVSFILELAGGHVTVLSSAVSAGWLVFRVYCCWVVLAFIQEINEGSNGAYP